MNADRTQPPALRDYLTIFLVSCAVMIYQITLTRVLSVVVWYHFAFLVISLVMFGLGLPGVWFALSRRPLRYLPGLLLASGIMVPISVGLIVKFGAAFLTYPIALVLCVLPATLALGGAVCLILIKARGAAITRMYGIDLLGAALGAVAVIPLMQGVATPVLAAACGLLPLIGLALYGGAMRLVSFACMAVLGLTMVQGDLFQVTRSKSYDETEVRPIYETWSPTARITVFDESFFYLERHQTGFSWGRGRNFPTQQRIRQFWIEQDGSAGTPITEYSGDLAGLDHLLYDVTTAGYQLRRPQSAAIIGAGGGRDILSALLSGATDVEAIEINERVIQTVSERFASLSGDPYHAPGVTAFRSEGRSHLTHSDRQYDLIQISLVDSWAASTAGAFALAENNLYTVEAFELYMRRLTDDGLLATSRWNLELPRLFMLARSALETIGIAEPERHMAVVSASGVATQLLSKRPFGAGELARLDSVCAERGFDRIYPLREGQGGPDLEAVVARIAAVGLNVDPPIDDSPYFFHVTSPFRPIDTEALRETGLSQNSAATTVLRDVMLVVSGLALMLFLLPFVLKPKREPGTEPEPWGWVARGSLYFAAIGGAFMLFENMLVQRFVLYLGHPSYATTVILSTLLIGMGAGSMGAARVGVARLKRFGLAVPVFLLGLVLALPALVYGTLGLPLVFRIMLSCAVLVPAGVLLGLFFPLGMMRFGDTSKPWYWAINGVFGVVASVFSLALSMEFGFLMVGLLSAVGYVVAWLALPSPSASQQEAG